MFVLLQTSSKCGMTDTPEIERVAYGDNCGDSRMVWGFDISLSVLLVSAGDFVVTSTIQRIIVDCGYCGLVNPGCI